VVPWPQKCKTRQGEPAFQQIGTGATALTGNNTYSGATTVTAGALIVNASIANSAVTVNAGACPSRCPPTATPLDAGKKAR
jgi:autotransporter-associated beta strand protein